MKISISRQNLYLLIVTLFFMIFTLVFGFLVLIPEGKAYREQKIELQENFVDLRSLETHNSEREEKLKTLQGDSRNVILAFENSFSEERFIKQNSHFFHTLNLLKLPHAKMEEGFVSYEVNASSYINSPKSFYDFIESLTKGESIIQVEFPIHFKRDANLIYSSFTMKVYVNPSFEQNGSK